MHMFYLVLLATGAVTTHIKYTKAGTKNLNLLILTSLLLIQLLF